MSKARNNIPRAAIHVGAPAKSFSAAEGYEPERRGWNEKTYRLKNLDTNNHYDFSRKYLNFEINGKGEIVPLGSNPMPLHERLQKRLDELGFKPYKDKDNPLGNSDNSPNYTVGIVVSGDHDVLTRLAYGNQEVDFTLQRSNAQIQLKQGIKDWAMDTYHWACDRWGAENIIGFDVHLDETTPHIHIQTIPVAKTKARGRASVKYVHKDAPTNVLTHKEWKKLPEEIRNDFVRTEVERREKECVSYARVWGEAKYAVGRTYYQMHTDYYNQVGRKYGLERGDDIAMLPVEEKRSRVHKDKAVLEAERQSRDAIAQAQTEKKDLEGEIEKLEEETQHAYDRTSRARERASIYEQYAKAIDIKPEDLTPPAIETDKLFEDAWEDIQEELAIPVPAIGGKKQWQEDRRKAIKSILTKAQDKLLKAKEAQNSEILKTGKALYQKAMKEASIIIEKNKTLQMENAELTATNSYLRMRLDSIDENAIAALRSEKDEEIKGLQARLDKTNAETRKTNEALNSERQRADKAESQVKEILDVPEIKQILDTIQHNKKAFRQQIDRWIDDAIAAINDYALHKDNDFQPKQGNTVAMGIIAEAFKRDLDPADIEQRKSATNHLLEKMSWTGVSEFKASLTASRTIQLCEEMEVPKELMKNLLLAAGGRVGISTCGGGSYSELTNWDGTKKRNGWGIC